MKWIADTKLIKLFFLQSKTKCCIAEALPMGELSKGHTEKLFPTSEISCFVISIISFYTVLENMKWCKLHNLCKDHFALVHTYCFALRNTKQISNRCSIENSANPDISKLSKNLY